MVVEFSRVMWKDLEASWLAHNEMAAIEKTKSILMITVLLLDDDVEKIKSLLLEELMM